MKRERERESDRGSRAHSAEWSQLCPAEFTASWSSAYIATRFKRSCGSIAKHSQTLAKRTPVLKGDPL